ncbi:MAG: hypothetical protein HYZ15_04790 [Sphingobacteriales bacterium]|nr:hypothetical protein [Sphingobacteriales bacterium]
MILILLLTGFSRYGTAQDKLSIDLAAIRNTRHQLNGLNISSFYHFSERITGGIEVNRFFPVTHGEAQVSAWDFGLNFHWLLPLHHHLFAYPVSGISHTSEKEVSKLPLGEAVTERFWSFNTGAGLLWQKGKWGLHTEYLWTWGQLRQQFLLAGFSYEMELGHNPTKKKD